MSPIAPDHLGQGRDASVQAREAQERLEVSESRKGSGVRLGWAASLAVRREQREGFEGK